MPANTPRGFPYPLPTEPVAEGAQAIRNLAEAIDAKDAGRELAYAEVAIGVNPGAGATLDVVSAGAVTFDGLTPVLIEGFVAALSTGAVAGATLSLVLYDAAANLGLMGMVQTPAAAVARAPCYGARRLTPSAGSHTYILKATAGANAAGNVLTGAGYLPGFIRITRA